MTLRPTHSHLDMLQEVAAQVIATTLDTAAWRMLGRRNRIFVLSAGTGSITYKGESHLLAAPGLVWVPAGAPAQLSLDAGSKGAWLAISDRAILQVDLAGNIAEDMRRFAQRPQFGRKISREMAARLIGLMALMAEELQRSEAGMQEMIRHHLSILAILLWRGSDLRPIAARPAPRVIFSEFLRLVDQHMRAHWRVSDYARYLGVSIDRLTSTVQRATGQPPLAIIHARLHAEACQMLETSAMQIAEISASLGFPDPAYFSRFFKRISGYSPRDYRNGLYREVTSGQAWAAWP